MMSYKNILVQVDQTDASNARVAAAVTLAKQFKCALTGVFLKSEYIASYAMGEDV